MARSKKDGRHQGGHKAGKAEPRWRVARDRRRARAARQLYRQTALLELEEEQAALEQEIVQRWEDKWGWASVWDDNLYEPDDDGGSWYDDGYDWAYEASGDDDHEELIVDPLPEIHLAIDRVIRRHGLRQVEAQVPLLAAAFDVASWVIERAIQLSPARYVRFSD